MVPIIEVKLRWSDSGPIRWVMIWVRRVATRKAGSIRANRFRSSVPGPLELSVWQTK